MKNSPFDKIKYILSFTEHYLLPKFGVIYSESIHNDFLILRDLNCNKKESEFYRIKVEEYAKLAVVSPKWLSAFYVMLFESFSIALHQTKIENYGKLVYCKQMVASHELSIDIIFQRAKEYLIALGMYKELTFFESNAIKEYVITYCNQDGTTPVGQCPSIIIETIDSRFMMDIFSKKFPKSDVVSWGLVRDVC